MRTPAFRIPYTDALPPPVVYPPSARTLPGAIAALHAFLTAPARPGLPARAAVLTGAGLSVASGLADYRGVRGTYRVNSSYQPIYHSEFLASHEARKRYWARSFLGWPAVARAGPNRSHRAIGELGRLGLVRTVVTQNVDSFHLAAHPDLATLELHGQLRSVVCTSCGHDLPRAEFQRELARLNPAWAGFLDKIAAETGGGGEGGGDPAAAPEQLGITTNPDGDVDVPGVPYTTFRYPPCPRCLSHPAAAGAAVLVDADGAWHPPSDRDGGGGDSGGAAVRAGILKPAVVMFGESIGDGVRAAAEVAIDGTGRLLVLATSLATYSALRLARRARQGGRPVAIVNVGGVRAEDEFAQGLLGGGEHGLRIDAETDAVLEGLVERLREGTGTGAGDGPMG